MKKIFTALLLAAACATGADAADGEATSIHLGYVEGRDGTKALMQEQADAEVSAAIFLPAETLAKFPGCELSGVRAALAARLNIDRMTMWVRRTLDGENLAETTITKTTEPALSKGWNEGTFASSWTLPEQSAEGVYVGVTYHQTGAAHGMSYIPEGNPGAGFVRMPEEEWRDSSEDMTLCIEAVLTGDRLPVANLSIVSAGFSPYFVLEKGLYSGSATIRNLGIKTVTGFDIEVTMQDAAEPFRKHYTAEIPHGATFDFEFEFEPEVAVAEGDRAVKLEITAIDQGTDTDPTDNAAEGIYRIVPYDMTRRVLVEEFTGEKCSNCPRVAGWLHEILAMPAYKDRVVPLCHHVGYGTDPFTLPGEEDYLFFYSPDFIYAPAVMADRKRFANNVPAQLPDSRENFCYLINEAMAAPASISVVIDAAIAGNEVNIKVKGAKSVESLCKKPNIVCVLTEDEIPGPRQSGWSGPDVYMHRHVGRALNSIWGETLEFDGDRYEYTCTLPYKPEWKVENLNVVVYVYNFDSSDRNNCHVLNSAMLPASKMDLSSVTEIDADTDVPGAETAEWFTISGTKLLREPSASGVYILRRGAKSEKVLIK